MIVPGRASVLIGEVSANVIADKEVLSACTLSIRGHFEQLTVIISVFRISNVVRKRHVPKSKLVRNRCFRATFSIPYDFHYRDTVPVATTFWKVFPNWGSILTSLKSIMLMRSAWYMYSMMFPHAGNLWMYRFSPAFRKIPCVMFPLSLPIPKYPLLAALNLMTAPSFADTSTNITAFPPWNPTAVVSVTDAPALFYKSGKRCQAQPLAMHRNRGHYILYILIYFRSPS